MEPESFPELLSQWTALYLQSTTEDERSMAHFIEFVQKEPGQ